MNTYRHLTIDEREKIMIFHALGHTIGAIAVALKRHKSTISRELKRCSRCGYTAQLAQQRYQQKRAKCKPNKKLKNAALFELVKQKFIVDNWSPEQISQRLKQENSPYQISFTTIYRAINDCLFDNARRTAKRYLRHKGKRRHRANSVEKRGKIIISHELNQRPQEANERSRLGDWEADTVSGQFGKACLLTLNDRRSRFLIAMKLSSKKSEEVVKAMETVLRNQPLKSITPDRGKEFAKHQQVTSALNVEFYFPPPHQPWQRGTNENSNGLLRQYFSKGMDMTFVSAAQIQAAVDKLNHRPRKCLNWKTPYEVYFDKVLHLI
ncbi:IS30 family transposase [Gallibacterium salpingitidis]|uniref:IS30 family transposase n=1 Tax=Gallibacterium salpingitidis TaxID=505341 RepID=UPI00266FC559|nr:IS30 family transposase [Gallibacterium salpingitidis]WKT00445.1 IS30 family transposase [Gallibacterium salpingitidis]